jgi:hypothetical protein
MPAKLIMNIRNVAIISPIYSLISCDQSWSINKFNILSVNSLDEIATGGLYK